MNSKLPNIGERVEFASHFIPKCEKLLDLGCGDGVLKEFLGNKVKKIYGVDNDSKLFSYSKKRYYKVNEINLDTDELPYGSNFFDCAVCLDVIEHVINPDQLLEKIYRILKPGGLLIISTPNIRFSDHLTKLLVNGVFPKTSLDTNLYDGGHIHFFTYKDLYILLKKHNFIILKEEGIINKRKRGWKGRVLEFLLGKKVMNEFRSPGILYAVQKL